MGKSEWVPTCFSDEKMEVITIERELLDSARRIRALVKNIDTPITLYDDEDTVLSMFLDIHQKTIIESLLISPDASISEISELIGVSEDAIKLYSSIFFDISGKLSRRITLVSYIEGGIQEAESAENEQLKSSYMFKKWSMSLGKEFIIWKYSLRPIDMSTSSLYNTIVQEAFFYHKEKSLSDKDVASAEYQRSMNSLLSGLKIRQELADTDMPDATDDFMQNLDIIISEEENTYMTAGDDDFINNVEIISKDDIGDIYETKGDNDE